MTNFNFLFRNLSYLSSEDLVGRPMDSTCFRSAPVPPSFCLRLHPLRMVATLLLILCVGVGNVWGETITLTYDDITATSYSGSETTFTDVVSFGYINVMRNNSNGTPSGWAKNQVIQVRASSGQLYNKAAISTISNIRVYVVVNTNAFTLSYGTTTACSSGSISRPTTATGSESITYTKYESKKETPGQTTTATYYDFDLSSAKPTFFKITNGSNALYVWKIVITYSAASCSENPTIGTASLNGSFNMTSTTSSIGVSSGTCSTGNAACDWTDYGFVWSDGANTTTPTVGGTNCNKVQVGTTGNGTSWTGSITPSGSTTPTSWTTGHTYYVRTYGKNSKAGAAFVEGSAWSFTPYMVTFNKNDGGATTSTQYVQGGVSTPLTSNSFSRTGYTFNGWNTDADGTSGTGYTNGQSVSLSANLTLYAKWSAKQCTISFDIEGGTGTITNVTATYGQAMPSKESNLPTKTGYNFGGFWDGDGGTGTQYYNADGTSKINWNKDVTATQTLYAKWTIKNYSVTWKVNGEDYTAGTPTDNVNHGSHVTDLPTAPSTASYCGDKFMGWTDATDGAYVHGTSNLYTKASEFPNATTAQTFYAVFADYKE